MLAYRHIARFRCAGSDCADHCCAAWGIDVSARSWAEIQALEAEKAADAVAMYPAPTPERVGRIRMRADGFCPLLSREGWCRLQQERGEPAIPDTCASYPRSRSARPGAVELSGFLSCPEVARLALLEPGGMELEEADLPPQQRVNPDLSIDRAGPYFDLLVEVRASLAELGRGRPLAQRLWLLANLSARSVAPFGRHARDPQPIRDLLAQFSDPGFQASFLAQGAPEPDESVSRAFVERLGAIASDDGRFRKPQARVLAALRAYGGSPGDWAAALPGIAAARDRWTTLEAQIADPLGAYLRHQLLTRWYTEYPDLALYAQHLLAKCALVRLLAQVAPEPPADALILAVYGVDRLVEHNTWMLETRAALAALRRPFLGLAGALITL